MKKILVVSTLAVAIAASGCANMSETQQTTAKGAGVGAAAGAVLGAVTGNRSTAAKGAVIGAGVGALGGYIWSQRMEEQKRRMEQATQGTGVQVTQTPDNQLKLNIPSDISFDVGRSNIKSNFAPVLDQFAASLRNNPATDVRIVGHTDSTGSDAVNNPLSVDRAASTRDYLVARGVPAQRIAIEGRGARQPIASNDSAAGRAQNRRVEIFVGERQETAQR
ncbi:OmpA family protein [Caldimonas tepidiphila]|uniref:OmpA family protein n=1 Tax=Caldimonas tepidiphila TaxID=2315841 RepID=UPI000E5A4A9B|nr:OmpA family protein [Caldimonas tepidiphila]